MTLIFAWTAAPISVAAADPCAGAGNQLELNECAQKQFLKADAKLNAAYKPLLAALDQEHQVKLRAAQRAWIAFRDAECELEASQALHGSMEGQLFAQCREAVTQARITELAAIRETLADFIQ
jgi:uncharacterized protein YecT (DUF1311 family)